MSYLQKGDKLAWLDTSNRAYRVGIDHVCSIEVVDVRGPHCMLPWAKVSFDDDCPVFLVNLALVAVASLEKE